ncbi:hypothetical protein [Streptomyces sp. NPDC057702]|uniref:hypothetical protein n=1 Tax=unclassified Streptomyces TaxID=2593676 RepID=UPI0036C1801B
MSAAVARVDLLVWRPADADAPGDLSAGWPRVLQVRAGDAPWRLPGVLLRPGEPVRDAAARVAYALGLGLPPRCRVLVAHRQLAASGQPVRLTFVLDGGWVGGSEVALAEGELSPCRCRRVVHRRRWAPAGSAGSAAIDALRVAVSLPASAPVREESHP